MEVGSREGAGREERAGKVEVGSREVVWREYGGNMEEGSKGVSKQTKLMKEEGFVFFIVY